MSGFEIAIIALLLIIAVPSLAAFAIWLASMTAAAALWVAVFGGLAYVYPKFWQFCVVMIVLAIGQALWTRRREVSSHPY